MRSTHSTFPSESPSVGESTANSKYIDKAICIWNIRLLTKESAVKVAHGDGKVEEFIRQEISGKIVFDS